jgi:hypothetical protein
MHRSVLFVALILLSFAFPVNAQEKSAPTVHTYYIAADEVERNDTPLGIDKMMGIEFTGYGKVFTERGPHRARANGNRGHGPRRSRQLGVPLPLRRAHASRHDGPLPSRTVAAVRATFHTLSGGARHVVPAFPLWRRRAHRSRSECNYSSSLVASAAA